MDLKSRLKRGDAVVGTWSIIPSPVTAEIIGKAGLDFIIFDQEHGPVGLETLQTMVMACKNENCTAIVRVPDIKLDRIQNVLDIGAQGIQVPNVEDAQACKRFISYAKYPPEGVRGFSPFTRAGGYIGATAQSLMQSKNDALLTVANIEGPQAIDRANEITSVPGLDVVFVGLFDLSKALGIPGDIENPLVIEGLKNVIEVCQRNGVAVGTIATSLEMLRYFQGLGVTYLVYWVDCAVLSNAYAEIKGGLC